MNKDEELLNLFAGLAMVGFIIRGKDIWEIPSMSFNMAKNMLNEQEMGITAIAPKRKYIRKKEE